jgi:flavodoxin
MKKEVEVITMLYKSTAFADFILQQLQQFCTSSTINCSFSVICNDARSEIIDRLLENNVKCYIYNDDEPKDYYLNRVYRAWNYGGFNCDKDNFIFVNSDMAFSSGWIDALFKYHDGINIPCSRLVESGKLEVGAGISNRGWAKAYNFGTHPSNFNKTAWEKSASISKIYSFGRYGLYMPCLFNTERFREAGGYPQGNIYIDGVGKYKTGFIKSGDDYFFHDILEKKFGMKHITVFDSLVYHMQEGEKDEI